MKKRLLVIALLAVLFSLGASKNADAGRWCHRGGYGYGYHAGYGGGYGYRGYYRPRPYFVAPAPVVVVGPRWGYGPRYHGGYGYRRGWRRW